MKCDACKHTSCPAPQACERSDSDPYREDSMESLGGLLAASIGMVSTVTFIAYWLMELLWRSA